MSLLTTRGLIATGVALFVLAALVALTLLWGNARYDAGVSATDKKWAEASATLARKIASSGEAADVREADRIESYVADVAEERKSIDEAVADGRSPFDVMFGVRADADRGASQASR